MDVLRDEITPSLFWVVQLDERNDIRTIEHHGAQDVLSQGHPMRI